MVTFDLKYEDLSNIDFSFADLGGVELNGANLTNANFTSADMHSSIWDAGVMVSNTVFRYTNLSGVDFHSVNLQSLDFYGANLSSTDMSYVVLDGSDLRQSDISGADFTGASLVGVLFNPGVVTNGAMFTLATMYGIDMSNMTLSGAVGFQVADLRGANFSGSDASSASFYGADLRNADFRNANLSYADFTNAVLTGADFTGATLTGADFTGSTDGPDLTTTTTSSTTTTTVAAATCASGGSCVVGDTGPGGGTVVYTAGSGSTTYMEVAPQTWYSSTEQAFRWCYPQTNTLAGASGTAVGSGLSNTNAMRALCTSNGAAYWLNHKNVNGGIGGKTDWIIPSKDELNYVCLYARQLAETAGSCSGGTLRPGFVGAGYWSSSEYDKDRAWYQNFLNGGQAFADGLKGASVYVRPVRFFGP